MITVEILINGKPRGSCSFAAMPRIGEEVSFRAPACPAEYYKITRVIWSGDHTANEPSINLKKV